MFSACTSRDFSRIAITYSTLFPRFPLPDLCFCNPTNTKRKKVSHMNTTEIIGISACVLAAVHTVIVFPTIVKAANSQSTGGTHVQISLLSGIAMYACLLAYASFKHNYILAFVQMLGLLKYGVILIQLAINKNAK